MIFLFFYFVFLFEVFVISLFFFGGFFSFVSMCVLSVQHIVEKFSTKVITLFKTLSQSKVYTQRYELPKLWES
jgi:hypothetical protein